VLVTLYPIGASMGFISPSTSTLSWDFGPLPRSCLRSYDPNVLMLLKCCKKRATSYAVGMGTCSATRPFCPILCLTFTRFQVRNTFELEHHNQCIVLYGFVNFCSWYRHLLFPKARVLCHVLSRNLTGELVVCCRPFDIIGRSFRALLLEHNF
jgi:hypothetical protein